MVKKAKNPGEVDTQKTLKKMRKRVKKLTKKADKALKKYPLL